MRRPRVVVLRAGLYVAVALSGLAAAYVLKEWLPHLWEARHPARALPDKGSPDDDKPSPSPKTDARQTDEVPAPAPVTDPDHPHPLPSPNTDAPTPSTSQTKSLPPLRTHSLPPPLPNAHAILSGSSISVNVDTIPSPTSAGSFHVLSGEDGAEDEITSQTNTSDSDPLADSFLDLLSPTPTHVISRRRSMRAHDLFAASHISFAELGSLVAPQDDT